MSGTDTNRGARARPTLAAVAVLLAVAWAPAALAVIPAQVVSTANMRAGPSTFYPIVWVLGPGTPVQLFGCEPNWGWCDVQFGANRGWVDAWMLQAQWGGAPVVVASSGAGMALPIITFSFNNYWNTWYRGRPWYANRGMYFNYWNRFPAGRPPPRPVRPPPVVRPPPRPPPGARPPPRPPTSTRPPPSGSRPPGNTPPPGGGGRPPPGGGGGSSRPPGGGSGGNSRPPGQGRPSGQGGPGGQGGPPNRGQSPQQ